VIPIAAGVQVLANCSHSRAIGSMFGPNKDAAELAVGAVEAIPGAEGHQVLEGPDAVA
jgi:hypothetical protein